MLSRSSIYLKASKAASLLILAPFLMSEEPLSVPVDPPAPTHHPAPLQSEAFSEMQAAGMQEFALNIYKTLSQAPSSNLAFSPFSISSALTVAYLGARGKTAAAMQEALRIPEKLPLNILGEFTKSLNQRLISPNGEQGYDLRIANRLWMQKGYPFQPTFLRLAQKDFADGLAAVDFTKDRETVRSLINNWVKHQSGIENLIKPDFLTDDTRLVLTNALYFSGRWVAPFDKTETKQLDFFLDSPVSKDVVKKTAMMHTTLTGKYLETNDLQIAEIDYKSTPQSDDSPRFALTIFLPKTGTLRHFKDSLSLQTLRQLSVKLKPQLLEVFLPKASIETELDLEKSLTALGMGHAFDRKNADFSGMTDLNKVQFDAPRLAIAKVLHKTHFSIDENGTEAAAATAVGMMRLMSAPFPTKKPIRFRADHPFVFLLRDLSSGTILFAGQVASP